MPYRVDLELPGSFLVLIILGPVIALVVRRRWRLAVERREEVMRLAILAAEESARAEIEANLAFSSVSAVAAGGGSGVAVRPQCAVCYRPTTTRCSQCKAVRYCSGKCQILHWRQGHKENCHPPQVDNNQESISHLKRIQAEHSDLSGNSVKIDGNPHAKPFETFSKIPASSESNCSLEVFGEDDNLENKPLVDTSGTESSSDSFTVSSSSGCSTFYGPVETSDDASSSEVPLLVHNVRVGDSLSSNISPDRIRTTDVSNAEHAKVPPSGIGTASLSVNTASLSNNFQQKVPTCRTNDVECGLVAPMGVKPTGSVDCTSAKSSEDIGECQDATPNSCAAQNGRGGISSDSETYKEGDCVHSDTGSPLQMSPDLSVQRIPPLATSRTENSSSGAFDLEGTVQFKHRDAIALDIDKSVSVTSGRSSDKSKGFRSLSSASPNGHISSCDGGHTASCYASSKVDNASASPIRLSEGTPLGTSDLKTSMRRVVQQIKSSTFSRHQPSGLGSYMLGKYSSKMLFPYDLFVKLYNYDKMELRPCGLINCGNSCYANAVLQCLAFTRPLSVYLLEGLHSKTCPKQVWCFTCEFENLLIKVKQGKSPLSPISIISHIHDIGSNLGHGREEDAHEFLRYAIDAMQSMCLKEAGTNAVAPFSEETTLIQLTFGGYLRSKIKCMSCKGKSEQQERMMDLTVEINGDIKTLEEALKRFTATEVLDGDNKYKCNRCKSYERAKKKLTILEAPNVLTIALKRFQSGKFGKLNKSVRFPEYLNLAPYMSGTDDKSPVYRLYAVVVHQDIMNAAFSGHYVCYVKNTQGKWYKIDDSVVKPVELERVLKQGAYMLLYARCSPRAPSVLRKAMVHDHGTVSKSRSNSVFSRSSSSVSHNQSRGHPQWTTDGPANSESFDFFNERFHPYKTDSSSDSSSLFSCSDEGSWSTESTRDSTSTEEYSEYLFGDSDRTSWNSPLRFPEDTNGLARSPPVSSRHWRGGSTSENRSSGRNNGLSYEADSVEADGAADLKPQKGGEGGCFRGERSPSFLYSDSSKECRKLTEQCSDSASDWIKSCVANTSVLSRRCSRERTTQTFY